MTNLEFLSKKEQDLLNELDVVRSWIAQESLKMGIVATPIAKEPIYRQKDIFGSSLTYGSTYNEKFINVLAKAKRFMKVREIAEEVVNKDGGDIEELVKMFSRKTKGLKDDNKIVMYKGSNSNLDVYWGSPAWLDGNGKIKEGYEFDESTLKSRPLMDIE